MLLCNHLQYKLRPPPLLPPTLPPTLACPAFASSYCTNPSVVALCVVPSAQSTPPPYMIILACCSRTMASARVSEARPGLLSSAWVRACALKLRSHVPPVLHTAAAQTALIAYFAAAILPV